MTNSKYPIRNVYPTKRPSENVQIKISNSECPSKNAQLFENVQALEMSNPLGPWRCPIEDDQLFEMNVQESAGGLIEWILIPQRFWRKLWGIVDESSRL